MTSIVRNIDQRIDMTVNSGCVFALFSSGSIPAIGMIAERSTNPSASFVEVGRLDDIDVGGTVWIDRLPLDDITRYYRFKQSEPGWNDGPWSDVVSATPKTIPQIDWSSKPWLLDSSLPLQLVATIHNSTPSSYHITMSRNYDPGGGTPTVYVDSYTGVPAPTPTGSNGWTVLRPSESAGIVHFRNELTGRQSDYASIQILPQIAGDASSDWLTLDLHEVSSSLAEAVISVSVLNESALPIGIGVLSSRNVGTITRNSPGIYTIARPTSGIDGDVTFIVSSSVSSVIADTDTITIDRFPGRPALKISTRTSDIVPGRSDFTASFRVTGSHQLPTTPWPTPSASFQPLAGMNVQFINSQSISGERYYHYRVSRPNAGQGTGTATFFATLDGWTRDMDHIQVPENVTDIAQLFCRIDQTSGNENALTLQVTATDPLGTVTPALSYSFAPGGSITVTGTNPYTVSRPDTGTARITFFATHADRATGIDATDIQAHSRAVSMRFSNTVITPSQYSFAVTGSDIRGAAPSLLITSASGVPALTRTGFGSYTSGSAPQNLPYSYHSASYTATRADVGGPIRSYNFAFSKTGIIGVDDDVLVNPKDPNDAGVGSVIAITRANPDIFANSVDIQFTVANPPSPAYYELWWFTDDGSNYNQGTINLGASTTYTHTQGGANGHGLDLNLTGTPVTFGYFVQATQSMQQTGNSGWIYKNFFYS